MQYFVLSVLYSAFVSQIICQQHERIDLSSVFVYRLSPRLRPSLLFIRLISTEISFFPVLKSDMRRMEKEPKRQRDKEKETFINTNKRTGCDTN